MRFLRLDKCFEFTLFSAHLIHLFIEYIAGKISILIMVFKILLYKYNNDGNNVVFVFIIDINIILRYSVIIVIIYYCIIINF